MFKKIIISIILASLLFVNTLGLAATSAQAQEGTWYSQTYDEWYDRVYDDDNPEEIFGERYTAAQVEWVLYGIIAFIMNQVVEDETVITCAIDEATGDIPLEDIPGCTAALVALTPGLPFLSNAQPVDPVAHILSGDRPISGIGYLRTSASKLNLVPEAYAQGFGFEAASSMRALWEVIRNVTYFLLVLLIIAMSFMIMFRFKISPQTVITIQSAIPRIIGALILITFSYAIAGFMIDLIYVISGVIAAILSSSPIFDLDWTVMYTHLIGLDLGGLLGFMLLYLLMFVIIAIFALFSNIIGMLFFGVTAIIWVIIAIIAIIAVIFILFKCLWMLIKTFVTVLLLIAAGPIFIVAGGIKGWLQNLAGNLAVFVVIGPMFAISCMFLASAVPSNWIGEVVGDWVPFGAVPNFLDNNETWSPPWFGIHDLDIVWLFASFVVITLVPNVANIIKSAIQRRPFGFGTAIGAVLGGAAGTAWSPIGTQISSVKDAYYKQRSADIIGDIQNAKYGQRLQRMLGL